MRAPCGHEGIALFVGYIQCSRGCDKVRGDYDPLRAFFGGEVAKPAERWVKAGVERKFIDSLHHHIKDGQLTTAWNFIMQPDKYLDLVWVEIDRTGVEFFGGLEICSAPEGTRVRGLPVSVEPDADDSEWVELAISTQWLQGNKGVRHIPGRGGFSYARWGKHGAKFPNYHGAIPPTRVRIRRDGCLVTADEVHLDRDTAFEVVK